MSFMKARWMCFHTSSTLSDVLARRDECCITSSTRWIAPDSVMWASAAAAKSLAACFSAACFSFAARAARARSISLDFAVASADSLVNSLRAFSRDSRCALVCEARPIAEEMIFCFLPILTRSSTRSASIFSRPRLRVPLGFAPSAAAAPSGSGAASASAAASAGCPSPAAGSAAGCAAGSASAAAAASCSMARASLCVRTDHFALRRQLPPLLSLAREFWCYLGVVRRDKPYWIPRKYHRIGASVLYM